MPQAVGITRSLDYLKPEDEAVARRALDFVAEHRSDIPAARLDFLRDTLDLLAEWRLPARCFQLAVAAAARSYVAETRLRTAFSPPLLEAAAAQATLSDAAFLRQPAAGPQQLSLRGRLPGLFQMAYADLEALLICVADHTALMRGLKRLDDRRARAVMDSNIYTYGSILEMLGLWALRTELGDVALCAVQPGRFKTLQETFEKITSERALVVEFIRRALAPVFIGAGLAHELTYRPPSVSSIERQFARGATQSEVKRAAYVTLVVPTLNDCYQAVGIVHSLWPAAPRSVGGGLRDGIAAPKYNGYRALVTTLNVTVETAPGRSLTLPISFRIVSDEMNRINEWGALAARYFPAAPVKVDYAWWGRPDREVWPASTPQPGEDDRGTIKVFSAAGEVFALPEGSTPIDFAYRIHTQVGHHCARILINGQSALYTQPLRNGDIVEIEVDRNYDGPDPTWLDVVQTNTARHQIRRALKQERSAGLRRGREILKDVFETELARYHLSDLPWADFERFLAESARRKQYTNVDAMLSDITGPPASHDGHKRVSPNGLVSRFIASRLVDHIVRVGGEPLGVRKNRVSFAECQHEKQPCRVAPGTPIVGRVIGKGLPYERLVIYRRDCPNAPRDETALQLGWLGDHLPGQPVKVAIKAVDRALLLRDINDMVYALYDEGLWLHAVEARVDVDRSAIIRLTIDARRYGALEKLRDALAELQRKGIIDEFEVSGIDPVEKIRLLGQTVLPNPYTAGPAIDPRVFKGRENELQRIATGLAGSRVFIVVTGMNRVGKTSLLEYVENRLARECGFVPVYVTLHSLPQHTEKGFWTYLSEKVEAAMVAALPPARQAGAVKRKRIEGQEFEHFVALLDQARTVLRDRLLILLDEFNVIEESFSPADVRGALHHFRSIVEQGGSTAFIVSVQERFYRQVEMQRANRPLSWGLIRLADTMRLDYLDPASAERLVRDPLGDILDFEPGLVAEILALTACHPFHIHSLMRLMVEQAAASGAGTRRATLTRAHLAAVLRTYMDTGYERFLDFLQDYSGSTGQVLAALARLAGDANTPVSAAAIQEELGSQRPRAGRVDVPRILEQLHDLSLIEWCPVANQPAESRIRLPLFQRWLREHRPDLE